MLGRDENEMEVTFLSTIHALKSFVIISGTSIAALQSYEEPCGR